MNFKINGKEYKAKAFDFNMICDLEDMGVSIEKAQEKPMSMMRAYFALCAGKGSEYAGKEIEAHVIAGNDFTEIMEVMGGEMEKSDFFRALSKTAETETSKN